MKIHNPFRVALLATLGVGVGLLLIGSVQNLSTILLYVGTALFLSLGLDPVVSFLERRGLPRWAAVLVTILAVLGVFAGIIVMVVPIIVGQITQLVVGCAMASAYAFLSYSPTAYPAGAVPSPGRHVLNPASAAYASFASANATTAPLATNTKEGIQLIKQTILQSLGQDAKMLHLPLDAPQRQGCGDPHLRYAIGHGVAQPRHSGLRLTAEVAERPRRQAADRRFRIAQRVSQGARRG